MGEMEMRKLIILSIFVILITACQHGTKQLSENEAMKSLTPTKKVQTPDKNIVGGLYIKPERVETIKDGMIGIYLKLENKSQDNIAAAYNFTCMNSDKMVLKQAFPINNEEYMKKDISFMSTLPGGGKWEGYIYFESKDSNFILTYDDLIGHKKSFSLELKKKSKN